MAFTLRKYYDTLDVTADGEPLWIPPDRTLLWPTYFTLVTSTITGIFAAAVLMAYYWSTSAADRVDNWRSFLIWGVFALKFSLEIAASSSMYHTGTKGSETGLQSLWFQTCTMTNEQIALFGFAINLPQYCSMQVHAPLCVANFRNTGAFRPFFRSFWTFSQRWPSYIGFCIGGTRKR